MPAHQAGYGLQFSNHAEVGTRAPTCCKGCRKLVRSSARDAGQCFPQSLRETQQIVLNIRNFSIYAGTSGAGRHTSTACRRSGSGIRQGQSRSVTKDCFCRVAVGPAGVWPQVGRPSRPRDRPSKPGDGNGGLLPPSVDESCTQSRCVRHQNTSPSKFQCIVTQKVFLQQEVSRNRHEQHA